MAARVLVIEDYEPTRRILAHILGGEGFAVTTAASAAGALALLAAECPDLIILDLVLPGMEAEALVAELASRGRTVPLLVLSGHHRGEERAQAMGAAYLVKPFDFGDLLREVARLTGVHAS
jgi:DNA-binding response OmpR family regulator